MADDDNGSSIRQKLSLASVVIVMVVVGLPLWWRTTDVYRSSLPHSEIQKLQKQQLDYTISVSVDLISLLNEGEGDPTITQFHNNQDYNRNVNLLDSIVTIQCVIRQRTVKDDSFKAKLIDDIKNGSEISSSIGEYTVIIVDSGSDLLSNDSTIAFSSLHRHVVINNNISKEDMATLLSTLCGTSQIERLLTETLASKQLSGKPLKTRRVKISPGYQITMTMINPNPSLMAANWTIEHATDKILVPFLRNKGISMLGQYSVCSQVLYYTDVKFKSIYSKKHDSFVVKSSDLSSMISSVEAKLGSHVSQWPSLNFVLYLPKRSEWPLYIKGSEGGLANAFLVPQWGGVVLYNDYTNSSNSMEVMMEEIMVTFVNQLKLLFGLEENKCPSNNPTCVHKWDIDHVLIVRALESVLMASSSLHSLTTLLDNVKNMVISDHIQKEVMSSLVHIHKFRDHSSRSEWGLAYNAASTALGHSETAFFDPSILALLYFPDDQKYAIYIPLFLPISIPVVMAVISLIKKWKKKTS